MTEEQDHAVEAVDKAHERAAGVLAELVSVASVDKVYGEPVVVGDKTVITAATVQTGLGFGYGLDSGDRARTGRAHDSDEKAGVASWGRRRRAEAGSRGGGGGGGQAEGRPVAVLTIDTDGVHVEPVLDRTKIAMTALMAAGAIGWTMVRRGGLR